MTHDPQIARAVAALSAGELVAFPTETVYGLGGDATSDDAVARIFAAKGRPEINPLIVHVADFAAARRLGSFNAGAERLASRFWPGPLTLVVPKAPDCSVSLLATAGLDSIGIRVPAHPRAFSLLRAFGKPVAAPSANVSGRLSPTRAEHVARQLSGAVAEIVDEGPTEVGLESTIVSCLTDPPALLRPGGLGRTEIEAVLSTPLQDGLDDQGRPLSPGQLHNHYAPDAAVRLNASSADEGEALLAFGPEVPVHDGPMRNLSPSGDVTEAAANLFGFLHDLDAEAGRIAVMPVPNGGLGEAINDRLRKAAAPRPLDGAREKA
ncbi:MAG: L-threonylcarbamoyladenylate synthase [Pseudomonadota bacterium]